MAGGNVVRQKPDPCESVGVENLYKQTIRSVCIVGTRHQSAAIKQQLEMHTEHSPYITLL